MSARALVQLANGTDAIAGLSTVVTRDRRQDAIAFVGCGDRGLLAALYPSRNGRLNVTLR